MSMKRRILVIVGIALLISMVGIVAADTEASSVSTTVNPNTGNYFTIPHSANTLVKYAVSAEKYKLTIPGEINFQTDTKWNAGVSATSVTLASGRSLVVNVSSEHGWLMVQHDTNDNPDYSKNISYEMQYGTNLKADNSTTGHNEITLFSVSAGSNEGSIAVVFNMTDLAPELGTYQDKLTFRATVTGAVPSTPTTPTTP